MAVSVRAPLSRFALDVAEGLSRPVQKTLPSRYFYDDLGSALFEAITMLPEYGLTRADERVLRDHSSELGSIARAVSQVVELGSGSGRKTRHVLHALMPEPRNLIYRPIDVSMDALKHCERELCDLADVRPVQADWLDGLGEIASERRDAIPMLLLFLGSSIGNIDRECITGFLKRIRMLLRPGDFFLLGADLVKDVQTMLVAYDDPLGVTAAFNLNVLRRINHELGGDFDLRLFAHEARWKQEECRIEMHLRCRRHHTVNIGVLESAFQFRAGETIWTESSHKFNESELNAYAKAAGFQAEAIWIDAEWRFAETLWSVRDEL